MLSTLLDNRYRIIRVLGTGGFGETFLAEDTKVPSSRYCVIKQLKAIADNPKVYGLVKQRFLREAAVLEELGEACNQIPCLYANFTEDGQFYLVQEWVEGETLLKKVKSEGKQSEDFTRQVLIETLHILEYIHSRGIIHRDIKPDNIILRASDHLPVLIDFGAVKETVGGGAIPQTTKSIIIGTPGFMSSEQSMGRPTFASDLYGLGMTGIYLLTGKMPRDLTTDPETAEIVWQDYTSNASKSLVRILRKAVQFYPRDRYANANTMLSDLENNRVPTPIPLPSQIPTVALASKSNRGTVAASKSNRGTVAASEQLATELESSQGTSNPVPKARKSKQKIAIAAFLGSGILAGVGIAIGLPILKNYQLLNSGAKQDPSILPSVKAVKPIAAKPDAFYFLADSTSEDEKLAKLRAEALKKTKGFNDAGIFKRSDYPNLKGGASILVYANKFPDMSSCQYQLKLYAPQNPNAYCALASTDPHRPLELITASSVLPPKPESIAIIPNTSPEAAVREYYDLINRQNYAIARGRLSHDFQQTKSNNRFIDSDLLLGNDTKQIEVSFTSQVSRGSNQATINVELNYHKKNGDIIPVTKRIVLRWDNSYGWLLDDMRAI